MIMAENSAISWTDHTFNPWIGCTRVSPACDGCYAAALMGGEGGRFNRAQWGGPGKGQGTRDRTKDWRKPRKWNREAAEAPGQTFVFCASLADVFDNAAPAEWRRDLFNLIRETPNLTWLLLTKRPGMIVRLFREAMRLERDASWPQNAAIGCSIVNQVEANRDLPMLLGAKGALRPAFAFVSMEPLLGPVDLTFGLRSRWPTCGCSRGYGPLEGMTFLANDGAERFTCCEHPVSSDPSPGLDWVITGGETNQGSHLARPADPDWYRSLRDQCAQAGVPFHFKQWGEWQPKPPQIVKADLIPPTYHHFPGGWVARLGSDVDPCTLDGVKHDARPRI
jgi:protein gp37